MSRLLEIYQQRVTEGKLFPDADQERAITALDELSAALQPERGFWKKQTPKGFYFYGGVGRGKSMVMDLFFANVQVEKKRRVHFHAFMLEVHDFLHDARKARAGGASESIDGDLIACADKIANETQLLC